MPADLPLITVILEIIRRTPIWVWGVLAALVLFGSLQMRHHVLSRRRVALLPIGLGAYSLSGALAVAGFHATTLMAWAGGLAIVLAAGRRLPWASRVRHDAARDVFEVEATVWPLVLMLAVFAARYAVAVTLVFHREWAAQAEFAWQVGAGYGALTGLLASRALAILGRAGLPSPMQRIAASEVNERFASLET